MSNTTPSSADLMPLIKPELSLRMKGVLSNVAKNRDRLQLFNTHVKPGFDEFHCKVVRQFYTIELKDIPEFIQIIKERYPSSEEIQGLSPALMKFVVNSGVDFIDFKYVDGVGDAALGKMIWARQGDYMGILIFASKVHFKLHQNIYDIMSKFITTPFTTGGLKQGVTEDLHAMIVLAMQQQLVDELRLENLLPEQEESFFDCIDLIEIQQTSKDCRTRTYDLGDDPSDDVVQEFKTFVEAGAQQMLKLVSLNALALEFFPGRVEHVIRQEW